MEGLSSTLKRGALYSAAALVFGQVISFAQTLVLARLLRPEELGIFVAGTLLSGFLVSVTEGGLRGALIQRETDTARAADTVFWATGGTGVLLALFAVGTAPLVGLVASFDPAATTTVVAIAAANAGTMIIHGLTNVPNGLMQRQFNFRQRLIIDPARMLAFAVVSIAFAAIGYGPWSLVIGNYAGMLTWLVLSWWFAGWWPGFARPSYRLWREMAKFAYPLLMEGIAEKVRLSAESALIARGLDANLLGQYRYGQRLSLIPGTAVVQIGSYVLFPAFSRLASDPSRLRNAFLRAAQWSWIASAAVAGLIVAIGQPAVIVLLGSNWADAGLAFVALAGYGLGVALQAAGSEAIKATGRSQLLNWTTATSIVLGIGLLIALLPYGLFGVGLSVSITELVIGAVILVLTHKVIPYSVPGMVRVLLPPVLVAAAAAAAVGYLEHAIVQSDTLSTLLGVLALLGESILFAILFVAGMALVEPKLARRAVKSVKAKLRRGADEEDDEREDDGIERRDPRLDPPTMLIPVFTADETGEFGRRQFRDWGSPTAQTMVMPVVRPANPARPGPVDEITRVMAARAAADAALDRVEDAIEAGERPGATTIASALDGPTEVALPARRPGDGPPRGGPQSPPGGLPPHDSRPAGGPRPHGGPPVPGQHGPPPHGFAGPPPHGPGQRGPVRPGPAPGPAPGPQVPPRPGPHGPGRPGPPPPSPFPRGVPPGAGPNGGPRHGRQAPPNGGRGPRPPAPPRAMPPPHRRNPYFDDGRVPQQPPDEETAVEPSPRRHRYREDDDVAPADPTRQTPLPPHHRSSDS